MKVQLLKLEKIHIMDRGLLPRIKRTPKIKSIENDRQPKRKRSKHMNRHFIEIHKRRIRYTTLQVIREMQIISTMTYHFIDTGVKKKMNV